MTTSRQYEIISLLWLILASVSSVENWFDVVARSAALVMTIAYLVAAIWAGRRDSKEGRDG